MNDPARTERHLVLLDRLAELGVALAERICDAAPLTESQHRAFDTVSRNVRRSILLSHLIATGQLPQPRPARQTEPDPAAGPRTPGPSRTDDRTRLDGLDCLDVLTDPIELTVAQIAAEIRTVLAALRPNVRPETLEPALAGSNQGEHAPEKRPPNAPS